jgi:hypothetical protein
LRSLFRYILLLFGIFISIPLSVLLLFIPTTPVSPLGIIYLLSYFLIVIGMICAPWWSRRSSAFLLMGGTIAFATLVTRTIVPPAGTQMNLMTLPGQAGPRLLTRLLNEQDVVLFGTQLTPYLGAISSSEKKSLDIKFSQAFHEMKSQGVTPLSPFLTTYLNQQHPNQFDIVVAEPRSGTPPTTGIVFLHGFGGNFTVQCWLMAKAGDRIDAVTVCPSTEPSGSWWSSQGRSILRETLTYLQQRGVERIYLAGLSNGGIGASRLADPLKQDNVGLILISGADPNATITELPVLVLHGKYDERIPVSVMEQYASAAGPSATYHLFEGDHFLLLKEADQVQKAMVDWLLQLELDSE